MSEVLKRVNAPLDEFNKKRSDFGLDLTLKVGAGTFVGLVTGIGLRRYVKIRTPVLIGSSFGAGTALERYSYQLSSPYVNPPTVEVDQRARIFDTVLPFEGLWDMISKMTEGASKPEIVSENVGIVESVESHLPEENHVENEDAQIVDKDTMSDIVEAIVEGDPAPIDHEAEAIVIDNTPGVSEAELGACGESPTVFEELVALEEPDTRLEESATPVECDPEPIPLETEAMEIDNTPAVSDSELVACEELATPLEEPAIVCHESVACDEPAAACQESVVACEEEATLCEELAVACGEQVIACEEQVVVDITENIIDGDQ